MTGTSETSSKPEIFKLAVSTSSGDYLLQYLPQFGVKAAFESPGPSQSLAYYMDQSHWRKPSNSDAAAGGNGRRHC